MALLVVFEALMASIAGATGWNGASRLWFGIGAIAGSFILTGLIMFAAAGEGYYRKQLGDLGYATTGALLPTTTGSGLNWAGRMAGVQGKVAMFGFRIYTSPAMLQLLVYGAWFLYIVWPRIRR